MAIFLWVYALCSPMGGAIADRLSRKWLIVASLGVWSSVTLLMGQAANFHQLFALRAVMGLSEALYMPAGLSLIADYHRGPTRSLAIGAHLSGVYMGQALGGIGGWVAQEVSWRAAFAGCGAIGVAYALVLMIFLRDTDRGNPRWSRFDLSHERGSRRGLAGLRDSDPVFLVAKPLRLGGKELAAHAVAGSLRDDSGALRSLGHHHSCRRGVLWRDRRRVAGRSLGSAAPSAGAPTSALWAWLCSCLGF